MSTIKNRVRFDRIRIIFTIADRSGNIVHEGSYWLDDDTERRAFGQRCHEAMRDGFVIYSFRDMGDGYG